MTAPRHPWRWLLLTMLAALLGWGAWLGVTGWSAARALRAVESELVTAGAALAGSDSDSDVARARPLVTAAVADAARARARTDGPLWAAAAAVPRAGDPVQSLRALSVAADEVTRGLPAAVDATAGLDLPSLRRPDGSIDLGRIRTTQPRLAALSAALSAGQEALGDAPDPRWGAWLPGPLAQAQRRLGDALGQLAARVSTAESFVRLAPPMLGADGPRRYFVGIQSSAESRGTGGLVGTWAIVRAEQGRLSLDGLGSNSDLPKLDALPADLDPAYVARYGQDPRLIANSNVSPDFPVAARLWLATWRQDTGEDLDGALGVDAGLLGTLLGATGPLVLPDGTSLSGVEAVGFALAGVYEAFDEPAAQIARKRFQEQVLGVVFARLLGAEVDPRTLGQAAGAGVQNGQLLLWSARPDEQSVVAGSAVGGALARPGGPAVVVSHVNVAPSKLDAYLTRAVRYEPGCPLPSGWRDSTVEVALTSDLPAGRDLPAYVVGGAEQSATGPVNRVFTQVHLPAGARVTAVTVDGQPAGATYATEQGRPSVTVDESLPPGQERRLAVSYTAPASSPVAGVRLSPLADRRPAKVVGACAAR